MGLVRCPSLLKGESAGTIVKGFRYRLITVRTTFCPSASKTSQVFRNVFRRVASSVYRIRKINHGRRIIHRVYLRECLFSSEDVLRTCRLLRGQFRVRDARKGLYLLVIDANRITRLPRMNKGIIRLKGKVARRFVRNLLINARYFIVRGESTRLRNLRKAFRLICRNISGTFPRLIRAILLRGNLCLRRRASERRGGRCRTTRGLPTRARRGDVQRRLRVRLCRLPLRQVMEVGRASSQVRVAPRPFCNFRPLVRTITQHS